MSTLAPSRTTASRLIGVLVCLVGLIAIGSANGGQRVIGRLGQALRDVGIHSRMKSGSHIYYHTRQFEYLVVNATRSSQWTSVVLQNGSRGYIPSDAVATLPYNVLQPPAPQRRYFASAPHQQLLADRSDKVSVPSELGGVAAYATQFVGTPYKWGGTDLNGIDCSGFVKKMFGTIGINLPRTAAEQVNVGQRIERYEDLEAGDRLYFWDAGRGKIGHTGIYLGNGFFVHSSHGKGGVATSALTASWKKTLVAARR